MNLRDAASDMPSGLVDHQASGQLELTWPDGTGFTLTHAALRQACRCAACEQLRRRGPGVAEADEALRLVHIEPVGEQGLNLHFSDGHDRGIYPWAYLRQLGAL